MPTLIKAFRQGPKYMNVERINHLNEKLSSQGNEKN